MSLTIEDLLARESIRDLIHRFTRGTDRNDAAVRRSVLHEDATVDYGFFAGAASDFVTWLQQESRAGGAMPLLHTQHLIGQSLIAISGDRAKAESWALAHHLLADSAGDEHLDVFALRYLDEFERRDGVWKISHRRVVLDFNYQLRTDPSCPPFPNLDSYLRGHRGSEDPSYHLGFS